MLKVEPPTSLPLPSPPMDVEEMLDASQPTRSMSWLPPLTGIVLLGVIGASYFASRSSGTVGAVIDTLSGLLMLAIGIAIAATFHSTVRKHRAERALVELVGEQVQLRQWPAAATSLQQLLNRPMRMPVARVQALIYLTSVLARFERFDDAIRVQDYLLDNFGLDSTTEQALKVGRAMAMLREDHLFDADRALVEIRRSIAREKPLTPIADDPAEIIAADAPDMSAGLALVEMYRDVKTGHPNEAIATFNRALPTMRKQLGHRVADGYALVAGAFDFLGRADEAQASFERATLLSPWGELVRRYPELNPLLSKYRVAAAPVEAA